MKNSIKQFIADNFLFDDPSNINDTESLIDNSIIDSLGIVQLVGFVEENYLSTNVDISEIIPSNFDSINKIVSFVELKQAV